jgi:hypothetical protein
MEEQAKASVRARRTVRIKVSDIQEAAKAAEAKAAAEDTAATDTENNKQ